MIPMKKNACSNQDRNTKPSLLSCLHKIPLKSLISEGFFLFFVYCGAGFELPYAFSLYSRFPWPASTTTIPSSASCCMRDSVRLKLVPRDLESANRSLVGWSVRWSISSWRWDNALRGTCFPAAAFSAPLWPVIYSVSETRSGEQLSEKTGAGQPSDFQLRYRLGMPPPVYRATSCKKIGLVCPSAHIIPLGK